MTYFNLHDIINNTVDKTYLNPSERKVRTMADQINDQMLEAHEELDAIGVNPDRLADERDFDHTFVQSKEDVGEETSETLVD